MNPRFLVIVVGVGSFIGGMTVGYRMAERRLSIDFNERVKREVDSMRVYYENVKQPFATPEAAVASLIDNKPEEADDESPAELANQKIAYHKIVHDNYDTDTGVSEAEMEEGQAKIAFDPPPEPDKKYVDNVFADGPRIISQEEYMENESGYSQATLTYYTVEKVLTDARDNVIEDKFALVGGGGVSMFGEQSSDPNTVHIRNPKLHMEFEVVRHDGSFNQIVQGIGPNERSIDRNN